MRTLSSRPVLIVSRFLDADMPSADIALGKAVRRQSLETYINGMLIPRTMLQYSSQRNVVTVPWLLFAGDTIEVRGTLA